MKLCPGNCLGIRREYPSLWELQQQERCLGKDGPARNSESDIRKEARNQNQSSEGWPRAGAKAASRRAEEQRPHGSH